MTDLIKSAKRPVSVLNLFAYTGGASVVCSKAGASVTHVDASKGMTERAKENAKINGITNIRFIVDDCQKFIEREIRRGNRYDAIIMDPPSYGRGPGGEMWKLENNLADFVNLCKGVLSDKPLFVLINSYTTGLQPTVIANILKSVFGDGSVEADEIGLPTSDGLILPCGATGVKIWKN
jgi:23S rRNA (cytosine1962-C5)-methyltransferase